MRCVAAMTRTSALIALLPPTRSKIRSCKTRNNLTCIGCGISPISSRNKVPPVASSKRPLRAENAPVKAPFSWPNNSLSNNSAGIAPQLTGTKGPLLRDDASWMERAITSLPVPDSPSTKTFAPLLATWVIRWRTLWIASPRPTSCLTKALDAEGDWPNLLATHWR